jgi:hypothetical protein
MSRHRIRFYDLKTPETKNIHNFFYFPVFYMFCDSLRIFCSFSFLQLLKYSTKPKIYLQVLFRKLKYDHFDRKNYI